MCGESLQVDGQRVGAAEIEAEESRPGDALSSQLETRVAQIDADQRRFREALSGLAQEVPLPASQIEDADLARRRSLEHREDQVAAKAVRRVAPRRMGVGPPMSFPRA